MSTLRSYCGSPGDRTPDPLIKQQLSPNFSGVSDYLISPKFERRAGRLWGFIGCHPHPLVSAPSELLEWLHSAWLRIGISAFRRFSVSWIHPVCISISRWI